MKGKYSITGMSCSACSAGIERAVCKLDGVSSVSVSLMGESMTVEYDETRLNNQKIEETVVSLGYGVFPYEENALKERKPQPNKLKKRFFLSLILLIPLMYFSMGGMISLPQPNAKISSVIQAILSLAIIVINYKFFTSGAKAVLHLSPNMDTLVTLGSGISYAYSLILTVLAFVNGHTHAHLYFESSAMILSLVTLGKWLEEKSKRKTGDEIEKLIKLMPKTVAIERDSKIEYTPFSEIKIGDILVVKQGEYIPVDGKIVDGHAFIDRSAITGESLPIEVSVNQTVTGADIVKSGVIKIVAERVGSDTTLSQIVKMVKEAGASKAPIQKLADKISGIFVPCVTLIALITFAVWFIISGSVSLSLNYAISVLVISCPCSLGLATPVAVMSATGRGMSLGILFKDAEALQKTREVNCVLLDKTATLTIGQPKVTDFVLVDGDKEEILSIVKAIESLSNHPIAECIVAYATENGNNESSLSVEHYAYQTGKGATAEFGGVSYRLGNRRLLDKIAEKRAFAIEKEYSSQGKTVVFLAGNDTLLCAFAIADTLKKESAEAVGKLKDNNIRVAMLTGDNEEVAKAIAKQSGVEEYFAEALPKDKLETVKRLQAVGGFVAMVGDGINDSPALKEADIGIAMGNGTDIAIDSADIVLSHGDLRLVSKAIDLSKATMRNIKQNLFWAFFYNCVAIPVACGAFAFIGLSLSPMIGAGAMSASSLFVVGNALRLTRFDKKKNKERLDMKKTLFIEGMMCPRCVAHVEKALGGVSGVEKVEVNLKKKNAIVEFSQAVADEALVLAVTEAGYEVKKIS